MEDTHQILFGSANSFKRYCVHMKSPRTYVHPDRQTDRRTDRRKFFLDLFCLLRHKNHKHLSKGKNFFFFHSCDYNTFSFYILRMWWESKNWTNISRDDVEWGDRKGTFLDDRKVLLFLLRSFGAFGATKRDRGYTNHWRLLLGYFNKKLVERKLYI